MPSVPYSFIRGLEVEGRHPHDAGGWHITIRRIEAGEGLPLDTDPASWVEYEEGRPYPNAPQLHPSRLVQFFYYRRMRTSAEMERHLRTVDPDVPVSVYLFASWARPPLDDVIPMPAEGERPLPETHLVVLRRCVPERRMFLFRNTWGDSWGARGIAALSYEYVDRYCFESWVTYLERQVRFESTRTRSVDGRLERRWVVIDEHHRRVYGIEFWGTDNKERQGWAFVVETSAGLEVEELYVRQQFRGRGLGRALAQRVRAMADAKRSPLLVYVPFADCKQENELNYPALVATARHLRVQFSPCPVVWAAYFATDQAPGSPTPVEPAKVPPRPKSALEAVLAAAALLGGASPGPPSTPPDVAMAAHEDTGRPPRPGTEAWDRMNQRRWQLIQKEYDEGLGGEEQAELDDLQRRSLAAVEGTGAGDGVADEALDAVEARLAARSRMQPE